MILGRKNRIRNFGAQVLLTDGNNPLPAWQDEDASHHWECEFTNYIYISAPVPLSRTSLDVPDLPPDPVQCQIMIWGMTPFLVQCLLLLRTPFLIRGFSDNLISAVMKEVLPDIYWETF